MACFKLKRVDISKYQLQYFTSNPGTKVFNVRSETPLQASYQVVHLTNADQASFTFEEKFDSTPTVVAGFVSLGGEFQSPGVNVYVESVTPTGGVIRTSAPVSVGAVAVHAIYTGQ